MMKEQTICHGGKKTGKIIAIANQKGGVGKTSTTMNLGYSLSEQGYKVLLVDLDPQHNLTNYLNGESHDTTIATALEQEITMKEEVMTYPDRLIQSYNDTLDFIGTSLDLSYIEMTLISTNAREYILTDVFERLQIRERYDYVLIDCMPALNILLINALTACDSVLIPVEASYGAFEGLGQLFHYIEMTKKRLNRQLMIEGIIYTKVSHTTISQTVRTQLKQEYPNLVFNQEIKELTEARQSYAKRIPLGEMKTSRLSSDYTALAKELIEKAGE